MFGDEFQHLAKFRFATRANLPGDDFIIDQKDERRVAGDVILSRQCPVVVGVDCPHRESLAGQFFDDRFHLLTGTTPRSTEVNEFSVWCGGQGGNGDKNGGGHRKSLRISTEQEPISPRDGDHIQKTMCVGDYPEGGIGFVLRYGETAAMAARNVRDIGGLLAS